MAFQSSGPFVSLDPVKNPFHRRGDEGSQRLMAPKAMGGAVVVVASVHRIITQVCMVSNESLQLFHSFIHSFSS